MITVDFETYSEADLKLVGAYEYSKHPSTRIYCMAYMNPCGKVGLWTPDSGFIVDPRDLLVEAHNVFFERAIWENIMVPRHGAPTIHPEQWRCSMAKCAARGLPLSLDGATKALGLSEQKDKAGKLLMGRMCKPRKPTKDDPETTWWHRTDDLNCLYEYCEQDVRAERALSQALPDLSDEELKVWQVDQEINHRGIAVDRPLAAAALKVAEDATALAVNEAACLSGGAFKTLGQRDKILAWINISSDLCMEKLDKAAVIDALARTDLPQDVRKVLELKQQVSFASPKKYAKILASSESDGRVRGTLQYCGAATGRWAGRGVQPQNLPRPGVKDIDALVDCITDWGVEGLEDYYSSAPPVEVVSWALRGTFVAKPGHDLIAVDYSAIETRILMWLAGETEALGLLAEGVSLYIDLAERIYQRKVVKPSAEYDMGKRAILGLGYQMGARKFCETCANYGADISEDFAQRVVDTYRGVYSKVKKLWYEVGNAAMWAMKHKGQSKCCKGRVTYKRCSYGLLCRLPSGRVITYNNARVQLKKTEWRPEDEEAIFYQTVRNGQWVWSDTYSGKLVENIVQGIARDIMVSAMPHIPEPYDLVLTVHDELVAEVPEGQGSVEEMREIMLDVSDWARSIPLDAEGWRGKRYRK